jgi:hypothetical protein
LRYRRRSTLPHRARSRSGERGSRRLCTRGTRAIGCGSHSLAGTWQLEPCTAPHSRQARTTAAQHDVGIPRRGVQGVDGRCLVGTTRCCLTCQTTSRARPNSSSPTRGSRDQDRARREIAPHRSVRDPTKHVSFERQDTGIWEPIWRDCMVCPGIQQDSVCVV